MTVEVERYLGLLETRLSLLRALVQEFVDCRKEFVSMDLNGMHRRIAAQEQLCSRIRSLHPAIDLLEHTYVDQFGMTREGIAASQETEKISARLQSVVRDLREAQAEVGRLSQIHAAYLRRSSRTIQMLINFVGNFSLTYGRAAEPGRLAPKVTEKG